MAVQVFNYSTEETDLCDPGLYETSPPHTHSTQYNILPTQNGLVLFRDFAQMETFVVPDVWRLDEAKLPLKGSVYLNALPA